MKKRYWLGGLSVSALAASVAVKLLVASERCRLGTETVKQFFTLTIRASWKLTGVRAALSGGWRCGSAADDFDSWLRSFEPRLEQSVFGTGGEISRSCARLAGLRLFG